MNVAFDKWIPVVTTGGQRQLASLCEVLASGAQFADLAVRPHERVALMRLFLCVAHAALDGPKDYEQWCQVPSRLPAAATQYLDAWKDSFELFHPDKPWLQVAGLTRRSEEQDRRVCGGIGQELEPRLTTLAESACHGSFHRRCDLVLHGDAAGCCGFRHPLIGLVAARCLTTCAHGVYDLW